MRRLLFVLALAACSDSADSNERPPEVVVPAAASVEADSTESAPRTAVPAPADDTAVEPIPAPADTTATIAPDSGEWEWPSC